MHMENILSKTRWKILKSISQGNHTTEAIARSLHQSQPNINQNLRLIEAYGLITVHQETKSTVGKPKNTYHIKGRIASVTLLDKTTTIKRTISSTAKQQMLLHLLFLEEKIQQSILQYLFSNPEILDHCSIAYMRDEEKEIHVLLLTDNVDHIRSNYSTFSAQHNGKKYKIAAWTHSRLEMIQGLEKNDTYFKGLVQDMYILYDPHDTLRGFR